MCTHRRYDGFCTKLLIRVSQVLFAQQANTSGKLGAFFRATWISVVIYEQVRIHTSSMSWFQRDLQNKHILKMQSSTQRIVQIVAYHMAFHFVKLLIDDCFCKTPVWINFLHNEWPTDKREARSDVELSTTLRGQRHRQLTSGNLKVIIHDEQVFSRKVSLCTLHLTIPFSCKKITDQNSQSQISAPFRYQ